LGAGARNDGRKAGAGMMKLKPSDLEREATRLVAEGRMPSLSDLIDAIRKTKGDPEFAVPVIQDLLVRTEGRNQ